MPSGNGITCQDMCTGKAKNILMTQCRNSDGQIVSMKKIGTCGEEDKPVTVESGEEMGDIKLVEADDVE